MSDVIDIFFPTPSHVVVVWSDRYGVGKLPHIQEITSLPLELRLVRLSGIPIRWRIGVREGLAIWTKKEGFLIPRSTHVEMGREIQLGGLQISWDHERLVLSGPGVLQEKQAFRREYLTQVVLAIQNNPPAVWVAGIYHNISSWEIQVIHPNGKLQMEIRTVWRDPKLEISSGFMALQADLNLWAGHLAQNALPLVLQGKGAGQIIAGLSPRGRWLIALREQSEHGMEMSYLRWYRTIFRLFRAETTPQAPDRGFPMRISPQLKWAVRAGNKVWAIPLPPLPTDKKQEEHKETLRRIFPA